MTPFQEKQQEASLNIIRACTKISSALNNADNLLNNHPDKFKRSSGLIFAISTTGFCEHSAELMIVLVDHQEELIMDIDKKISKYEQEVFVEDAFTHEMVFYLAKLQSAVNNLKKIEIPYHYVEFSRPIISRVDNLMFKNHIQKLGILNQSGYIRFVEHFDFLGLSLISST